MDTSLGKERATRPWYGVIEGAIGVGKTTLARMLREQIEASLLLEVFEENPFLSKFYESRARYAFQTQMFFLLSRYRQQQQVPELMLRGTLIADYMFAKDQLFAQLNLAGDEWEVYQQLHGALAEQIAVPDGIVYLRADTDVLLGRIAQRDRPYERDMDREYIETLRQSYERFFASYQDAPVLTIDTNTLNFVTRPDDFRQILGQVRSFFGDGRGQSPLPELSAEEQQESLLTKGRPLADFQLFHSQLDANKGFITDVYFNYLCLSEELGELGSALADLWREEAALEIKGQEAKQARQLALALYRETIESELADCMAYLLKLANYAGIDLEAAYLGKMNANRARTWPRSLS
jgi:deoxyadenosine/deoxycytidine kinase/NTP pyrophosphatase (non-canonical NTP hydrolase)